MKYRFMEEHKETYKVKSMCEMLKVSRSGYYAWRTRQPSIRQKDNDDLLGHIREVHTQSRRLYGSPRITAELNEQGLRCGKNRVARIMKDHSIWAEVKKRRFRRTTDSRHNYALAANLLVGQRQTEGVWASDITFVPTSEGWLYVAAVMNVKSRKIIGLSMSNKLSQDLASAALRDAVGRQSPPEGLIHHSDRGRQYASYAYQELLKEYGITPSVLSATLLYTVIARDKVPKQSHYEIPRGVYPEQGNEILRSAQNDRRRAWNDKAVKLFS